MRTLYYKLIAMALGSLGLGCPNPMEYGMPHAKYHLSGRVANAANEEPVPGIQIKFLDLEVQSDSIGEWSIGSESSLPCDEAGSDGCKLDVRDVDGPANGGQFLPQQFELDLTQTERGSKWYEGAFEQHDITIELDKDE